MYYKNCPFFSFTFDREKCIHKECPHKLYKVRGMGITLVCPDNCAKYNEIKTKALLKEIEDDK